MLIVPLLNAQSDTPKSAYHRISRSDMSDSTKIKRIDSLLLYYKETGKKDSIEFTAANYSNWLVREIEPKDYVKSAAIYELVLENNSRGDVILQRRYIASSSKYLRANMYPNSFAALEKAIAVRKDGEWAAEAYRRIADNYYALGDYKLSSEYYERAEQLFTALGLKEDELRCFITSYNTLSRLGTSSAREKLRKNIIVGDSIVNNVPISDLNAFYMMRVSGLYYSDSATRNVEKGTTYLLKALEKSQALKDPRFIAETYQNLGVLYSRENPSKAVEYSELGLSYTTAEDQKERAALYANIGLSKAYQKAYDSAIEYLNRSITTILGVDLNELGQDEIQKVLQTYASDENLWVILGDLGQTYLKRYDVENDKSDLQNALLYFGYIDYVFDQLQKRNVNTSSKFLWRRKALEIYSLAIKASYLKKDSESVFRYMEKSKALVLIDEMRARDAMITAEIPQERVQQIALLKSRIIALESMPIEEALHTDNLLKAKRDLRQLTDSLKGRFNTYEINTFDSGMLKTLSQTKSNLTNNQCIVEFHLTSDKGFGLVTSNNIGYGILIDKKQTQVFEIPDLESLKDDVISLQVQLSRPFKNQDDIEQYQTLSHSIYTRLFPTEKIRKVLKGKELKIVLDDFLTRVPLEALSVTDNSDDVRYLVEETDCHYSYSITFDSLVGKTNSQNVSFLAIAPVQFNDKDLGQLDHSLNEVKALQRIFEGVTFVEEDATKTNFLGSQKESGILHLATHANATDSITPWISFRDEKLSLNELYLLNNNAAMVVLSACNTSSGELASGEGVLSLARGFFYGGAQSVVSSLWKVDDIATSKLMNSFYKQLDAGDNKATALNKAKLTYINSHTGSEASPYYWSSFILNGNIEAVSLQKSTPYWLYLLGILLILAIVYYFRKSRSS